LASMVTYQFPARGGKPPVKLVWYDGGLIPQRPAELEQGRRMGDGDGGVLFYGSKGTIMHGIYGKGLRIIPETKMQEYVRPEKTIPRSPGIHQEWLEAIKKGTKSTTDFSYSGKLTEVMLLGNIAIRMHEKNTVLEWDPVKMEITNLPEANQFMQVKYRDGWSLE
ncbi:MAG: gfo/Idh/MocA family oxidoreductase, partial [Bacteroidota bacterium]